MGVAQRRDSAIMLGLLSALAYAASLMTHEALGHGGYCLAVGGHITALTAWWENCQFPGAPRLGIKATGPLTQFVAGLLGWLVLDRLPIRAMALRWFAWLYMTWDLLLSTGYVAFSGVVGAGDAAELIAPLGHSLPWRTGLVLVGSVLYFFSIWASARMLRQVAGLQGTSSRVFRLVWISYLSAGVFAFCVAAVDQTLRNGAANGLAVASPGLNRMLGTFGIAAVSSFAAGSGMFGLPPMLQPLPDRETATENYLPWSAEWGFTAGAVLALFLVYVGPGS